MKSIFILPVLIAGIMVFGAGAFARTSEQNEEYTVFIEMGCDLPWYVEDTIHFHALHYEIYKTYEFERYLFDVIEIIISEESPPYNMDVKGPQMPDWYIGEQKYTEQHNIETFKGR